MNNQIDLNILNGKEVSTEGDDNKNAQYKSSMNFDFDAEIILKHNTEHEIKERKRHIKVPFLEKALGATIKFIIQGTKFYKIAADTLAEPFIYAAQRRRLAMVIIVAMTIGYSIAFMFVFVPS